MGFGDVKLVAMIGGIIGWGGALFTIMMGALLGSIGGGLLMAARRGKLDSEIPFGPFLAAAGYLYMVAGPAIVGWYFGRTGLFG
jgi:leader peptidase (prepilin peptidase)/N-methyltransferase